MVDIGIESHLEGSGPADAPTDDGVRDRSWRRGEPGWLVDLRLDALHHYREQPPPAWADDLPAIGSRRIPTPRRGPEAEPLISAAGNAQLDSETVFTRKLDELAGRGVVFCDMDAAIRDHPELVRRHLATVVSPGDNRFSALNTAIWSGGSFVYVPPGVDVDVPLQALVRTGAEHERPFERTLVIADEGSKVHYIEGCLAPVYTADPLRCPVVEVVVGAGADVTYTSIRNWSANVFNLATAQARVETGAVLRWIDGTIGSLVTRKHPTIRLAGSGAGAEVLSASYAGSDQRHDIGATVVHVGSETSSRIVARSISTGGGHSSYRAAVRVEGDADRCTGDVRCHGLVLDGGSHADPRSDLAVHGPGAQFHEETATTAVPGEQLFYLMSRGLSEQQAVAMVVNGFIEPITSTLPTEYAVEWSRVIELKIEGSVG